jgi:hypothetical protein
MAPVGDSAGTADHVPVEAGHQATQAWGGEGNAPAIPSLIEMVGSGFGNRLVLTRSEYWIGTDRTCGIGRPNDPSLRRPARTTVSRRQRRLAS